MIEGAGAKLRSIHIKIITSGLFLSNNNITVTIDRPNSTIIGTHIWVTAINKIPNPIQINIVSILLETHILTILLTGY